ncbi:MAG: hypothetical protein ACFFDF_03920 [Candidatus Odinarchaeota archaeon]
MTDLKFNTEREKYYIEEDGKIIYLSCGTRVNCISFGEIKEGIIEYAKTINKGYYLMLDNGNYIPMFAIKQLEIL